MDTIVAIVTGGLQIAAIMLAIILVFIVLGTIIDTVISIMERNGRCPRFTATFNYLVSKFEI